MKRASQLSVSLVVGMLFAACGEPEMAPAGNADDFGSEQAPGDAPPEASPPPMLPVAVFHVDGRTITFLAAGDGPDAVVMMQVGGSPESVDPISALMTKYGVLTALELFYAFAPDAEPPPALVATHPGEATAIGRTDDSVRHVEPLAGVTGGS